MTLGEEFFFVLQYGAICLVGLAFTEWLKRR
jgi:hypothetical protein